MRISVKNLGILKQADFELGKLTLVCGDNNTGKTYATYALFGFLLNWRRLLAAEVPRSEVDTLMKDGVVRINVAPYARRAGNMLQRGCKKYVGDLPRVFAAKPDRFKHAEFRVSLDRDTLSAAKKHEFERRIVGSDDDAIVSLSKKAGDYDLVTTLIRSRTTAWPSEMIREVISDGIIEILFSDVLPRPFISSAERTGAAMFRKELDFARSRLLDEVSRPDMEFDPMEFLFKYYSDYPLPVKANADFIRGLEKIVKGDSFLAEHHHGVLDYFADIIGGVCLVGDNDTLYFKPANRRVRLTMDESSSAVRSLLDIGFYLRHVAKPGDLLMVDEPELNLHPQNQRRIARLFARLVNLGVRVFATTHSDYIVKELNTLIMLSRDKDYLKRIAAERGYQEEELLGPEQIKVYIAEKALITLPDSRRRSRHQTFMPAFVTHDRGIGARSFDDTIDQMNEIQDAIEWDGDE